jgi:dihydrofolate reductase
MVGGASIFNEFLKYDLIDEFIITIIPVLLGEGILLFTKSSIKNLKLIDTKSYDCGVVQVHYKKI